MAADHVERMIDAIARISPQTVELAKLISLAARVEPELLRAVRLEMMPASDASIELDLWSSRLVGASGSSAMTLRADVAEHLRAALGREAREAPAGEVSRLDRVGALIAKLHAHHPEAIRIEERIRWRAVAPGDHAEEIAQLLGGIARTMIERAGDRAGLATWAARAIPALPRAAQDTHAAWTISLAAAAELGYPLALEGEPPRGLVEHFPAALLANAERVKVRVERSARELELTAGETGELTIDVPLTRPLLIEVDAGGDRRAEVVRLRPKIPVTIPVEGRDVALRTLDGREVLVSLGQVTSRSGNDVLPWEERPEWIEGATARVEGDPGAIALFIGERHALIVGATKPLSEPVTDNDGTLLTTDDGEPILDERRHRLATASGWVEVLTIELADPGVGLARLAEPWRGPVVRVQLGAAIGEECQAYVVTSEGAPPAWVTGTVFRERDAEGTTELDAVLEPPLGVIVSSPTPIFSRSRLIAIATATEVVLPERRFTLVRARRLDGLGDALSRAVTLVPHPPAIDPLARARLATWLLRDGLEAASAEGSGRCAFFVEAPPSGVGATMVTTDSSIMIPKLHRRHLPSPGPHAEVVYEARSTEDELVLMGAPPSVLELASATLPLAHDAPAPGEPWQALVFDPDGYPAALRGRVIATTTFESARRDVRLILQESGSPDETPGAPLTLGGQVRAPGVSGGFTIAGAPVLVHGEVVGVLHGRSVVDGNLTAIPVEVLRRRLERGDRPAENSTPAQTEWLVLLSSALAPEARTRGLEEMLSTMLGPDQATQHFATPDGLQLQFSGPDRLARRLQRAWRSGAMSTVSGGAVAWFEILDATSRITVPDDPQRGAWGWLPERDGRRLWARVVHASATRRLFEIELEVTSTDPQRPLVGTVELHLHPTFRETRRIVPVREGRATLHLAIYGAFTVGAVTDEGRTHLELDLANLPQLPEELLDG